MELNSIVRADILDGFKEIDDNSVDLIVTSPPYNVGVQYDSWDDNLTWQDYLDWCRLWIIQCHRVLKDDGRMCINHYICLHKHQSQFPLFDIRTIQDEIGLHTNKIIIWEDKTVCKLTAFGSWMSASAPHIQTPYEGILVSYKNSWKKLTSGESTISRDEFLDSVSGVWKCRPETQQKTIANFPIDLPRKCINLFSYKGDTVLDPFMGSGTTAVACVETGRNFLGIEKSEKYHKYAKDRVDYCIARKNPTLHEFIEF